MNYTHLLAKLNDFDTKEAFIATDLAFEPYLSSLWDASHRTIKDIADLAGISIRQIGLRLGIPQRTVENWSAGVNEPPTYLLLLIQSELGLFKYERDG